MRMDGERLEVANPGAVERMMFYGLTGYRFVQQHHGNTSWAAGLKN